MTLRTDGPPGAAPDAVPGTTGQRVAADVDPGVAPELVELPGPPTLVSLYRTALAGAVRPTGHRARVPVPVLPGAGYAVRGVRAEADRLTAYQHLVGEPGTDVLPAGFVHVLAFPLAMAVMVRADFPLRVLGLVHLANHVEQRAELRLGQPLDVHAWATGLRAHHAGTRVDLVTEVSADGATAWRGVSTYLAKGVRLAVQDDAADAVAGHDDDRSDRPSFEPPTPTASWRLPADTGRRYAAVSGDVNPIHLWAPAARAFGFRGAIAHGMDTAARALAAVGAARGASFRWSVDFAAPVVLPTTVAVRVAADGPGSGHLFTVWDPRRGRPHLTGSVTRLHLP